MIDLFVELILLEQIVHRNNLVFYGIREEAATTPEAAVRDVIKRQVFKIASLWWQEWIVQIFVMRVSIEDETFHEPDQIFQEA